MKTKKSELQLFIIWKNAMKYKNKILNDIEKTFKIRNKFLISWSKDFFSSNLTRFYGVLLPDGCGKEAHIGKGEFLLIIVEDDNPVYEERQTSHGQETVNSKMFDKKTLYRKWTAGIASHMIHATNNEKETNHDLTLLLDCNINDFKKIYKPSEDIVKLKKDLFGAKTWNSAEDMFYALNNCTTYTLLRNWESLPEEIYVNEHNDIDVLCISKEEAAYILNAKKAQDLDYRVQYYVDVNDKTANFDLRYLGDNYYDINLEKRLLDKRVYNKKGFYTLNEDDYFYALLYHAIIQKPDFKKDYQDRLVKMNKDYTKAMTKEVEKSVMFLEKWMLKNEYTAPRPIDKTVFFNTDVLKFFSPLIYKDDSLMLELEEKNKQLENQIKELNTTIQNLEECKKENVFYKNEYYRVINSKGWKLLEKLRKLRIKK